MKPLLRIFVVEHCSTCDEARTIATWIERDFPEIMVELVDIGDAEAVVPETVFATPTFMLNNRIVSLGNPHPEEIARLLAEAVHAGYRH
jgi:hypothetical protein